MAALLIQARLPQSILEVQGLPEGPCHELHRDPELYKDVIKRREWSHMPTVSLSLLRNAEGEEGDTWVAYRG